MGLAQLRGCLYSHIPLMRAKFAGHTLITSQRRHPPSAVNSTQLSFCVGRILLTHTGVDMLEIYSIVISDGHLQAGVTETLGDALGDTLSDGFSATLEGSGVLERSMTG